MKIASQDSIVNQVVTPILLTGAKFILTVGLAGGLAGVFWASCVGKNKASHSLYMVCCFKTDYTVQQLDDSVNPILCIQNTIHTI